MDFRDIILIEAAKGLNGRTIPLWVKEVQELGVEQFVKMVKGDRKMNPLQEMACSDLLAGLLTTKLVEHAAIEPKSSSSTTVVLDYLDHLAIPVKSTLGVLHERPHDLLKKGWEISTSEKHDGWMHLKCVLKIRHKEWTGDVWWDTDKINTFDREGVCALFKKIGSDLDPTNYNDDLDCNAIYMAELPKTRCRLGLIEFVEIIARHVASDNIRMLEGEKRLSSATTLLKIHNPMTIDEFLSFGKE